MAHTPYRATGNTTDIVTDVEEMVKGIVLARNGKNKGMQHGTFAEFIGHVPGFASTKTNDDPAIEKQLEYIKLATGTMKRQFLGKGFIVTQDNTSDMFSGQAFKLKDLRKCIGIVAPKSAKGMLKASQGENGGRIKYFSDAGASADNAKAYSLALAFYTGSGSNTSSRSASLCIRTGNVDMSTSLKLGAEDALKDTLPIFYFTVAALAQIPYFFGQCIRMANLNAKELARYEPGAVVAWTQFASSNKGTVCSTFSKRNTVFHIYSMTGRHISYFSDYTKEDEVLFLPFSCFFTCGKYEEGTGTKKKIHIYLRQIEYGSTNKTCMWVDDHIFDEKWENKGHMEMANAQNVNANIHFVCKPTTELALSWFRSPLSKFVSKYKSSENEDFRIITDMSRHNEKSPRDAGARLVAELIKLGISIKILVFTSNQAFAEKEIKKTCGYIPSNVAITTKAVVAKQFITFEGVISAKGPKAPPACATLGASKALS